MAEEVATQATDDSAVETAEVDQSAAGAYEPEVSEDAGAEVEQEIQEEAAGAEETPPSEEPAQPEPEDNAERSRLGRKVKYIEDSVSTMQQQMLERMEQLQNMMYYRTNSETPAPQEDEDSGVYTRDDIRREIARIEAEKERATQSYNMAYTQAVSKLSSDLSEDEFAEIDQEFRANYNFRHSNDPVADAERNWYKAERAILRKKMATPKKTMPLKTEKPSAPLGGAAPSKTTQKKTPAVKLDDATKDFIRRTGMSEDKAIELLSRA
jgi:hypothetical protein